MEEEIWKPIRGFEDYYCVSNLGNVKSKERTIIQSTGAFHRRKEKILTPHKNIKNNMLQVMLVVHKRYKLCYVHRLVAEAFVDNPYGFKNVTHLNGDDLDNRAVNLQYISKSPKLNKKLNLF